MMWIKNLSLKGKILFGLLTIIFVNGFISFFGMSGLNKVTSTYEHVAKINFPNAEALSGMLNRQKDIFIDIQQLQKFTEKTAEFDKTINELNELFAKYEATDKWYQDIPFVEGEDPIYQAVAEAWKNFKTEATTALNEKKNDPKATYSNMDKLHAASDIFNEKISALISFQSEQGKIWKDNAEAVASSTKTSQITFILLTIFATLIAGWWFANSLNKQLNDVLVSISASSKEVGSAATHIATTSQELSQAASEQAASLQETSSAIEETSAMVNRNSESAKSAAANSTTCQIKAENGKAVVEKMMYSMDEINTSNNNIMDQINHSNSQISEIVKVIQEIGSKTKVINEIVFQTKLLSFNASVEAARAGENGKGFAVVAEEVGNLAQMSGNAAKEITSLLDSSIQKVENIVNETKSKVEGLISDGRQKVETGIDIAKQCGDVLNEIVQNIALVSATAGEISTASQDQAVGVQEITKAINQLDQVTQINASNSEQTAAAAEQLSAQTNSLNAAIATLVSTVQGTTANYKAENNSNFTQKSVSKIKTDSKQKTTPDKKTNTTVVSKNKDNKVVPFKKPTATAHDINASPSAPATYVNTTPYAKAAGDGAAPSHNHPGFKDV